MDRPAVALDAVETADHVVDGPYGAVPVRVYRRTQEEASQPDAPALVWAHGGGFAYGDLDMPEADWVSRSLAARGIPVVSVDYRLAPPVDALEPGELRQSDPQSGVHHPVPGRELALAFDWTRGRASELGADPDRVSIGGASAGANLAAGVVLSRLGSPEPVPAQLILAYPTLHAVQPPVPPQLRSLLDADPEADRFGPESRRRIYENYLGGPLEGAPVEAIPGTAEVEQLKGHPPVTLATDEVDELRISAEAYAESLWQAGADVEIERVAGVRHGHLNRPFDGPDAAQAAERTIEQFADRLRRAG